MRLLLAHGAKVNAKDQEGRTPLVILLSNWDTQAELVQLLLSKGAGVNARTKDATTRIDVGGGGRQAGSNTMLLAKGADINAKDNRGQTALMKAAKGRWWKHLEVVKLLVERGAPTAMPRTTRATRP